MLRDGRRASQVAADLCVPGVDGPALRVHGVFGAAHDTELSHQEVRFPEVPGPADVELPPDRPPTQVYEIYPKAHVPPFHYRNPVTGAPPHYPQVGGPTPAIAKAALLPSLRPRGGRTSCSTALRPGTRGSASRGWRSAFRSGPGTMTG